MFTLRDERDQWLRLHVTERMRTTHHLYRLVLEGSELFAVDRRILERTAGGALWLGENDYRAPGFIRYDRMRRHQFVAPLLPMCTICGWLPGKLTREKPAMALIRHQQEHLVGALRQALSACDGLRVRRDQLLEAEPKPHAAKVRWWHVMGVSLEIKRLVARQKTSPEGLRSPSKVLAV